MSCRDFRAEWGLRPVAWTARREAASFGQGAEVVRRPTQAPTLTISQMLLLLYTQNALSTYEESTDHRLHRPQLAWEVENIMQTSTSR